MNSRLRDWCFHQAAHLPQAKPSLPLHTQKRTIIMKTVRMNIRDLPPESLHSPLPLLHLPIEQPSNPQMLKMAIVGPPNAGKSTFLNQYFQRKISSVSPLVHTTRQNVIGVHTEGDLQTVFFDTPGVVQKCEIVKYKMARNVSTSPSNALNLSHLCLCIVDACRMTSVKGDDRAMEFFKSFPIPKKSICLLNKVDQIRDKAKILPLIEKINNTAAPDTFATMFPISALSGLGVAKIRDYVRAYAQPMPWEHHPEVHCTQTPLERVYEVIRELIYTRYHLEIPYVVVQQNQRFEIVSGTLFINQDIYCSRPGQLPTLVGTKGHRIASLITMARHELEASFSMPVELSVRVKVDKKKVVLYGSDL
eukprot:Sdes_comp20357_c2_seq1m14135